MDIDTLHRREAWEIPLSDGLSLMGANHYFLVGSDLPNITQGKSTPWDPRKEARNWVVIIPAIEPRCCRNMCRFTTRTIFIPKQFT